MKETFIMSCNDKKVRPEEGHVDQTFLNLSSFNRLFSYLISLFYPLTAIFISIKKALEYSWSHVM
jgi:hypothetical protein